MEIVARKHEPEEQWRAERGPVVAAARFYGTS